MSARRLNQAEFFNAIDVKRTLPIQAAEFASGTSLKLSSQLQQRRLDLRQHRRPPELRNDALGLDQVHSASTRFFLAL